MIELNFIAARLVQGVSCGYKSMNCRRIYFIILLIVYFVIVGVEYTAIPPCTVIVKPRATKRCIGQKNITFVFSVRYISAGIERQKDPKCNLVILRARPYTRTCINM